MIKSEEEIALIRESARWEPSPCALAGVLVARKDRERDIHEGILEATTMMIKTLGSPTTRHQPGERGQARVSEAR